MASRRIPLADHVADVTALLAETLGALPVPLGAAALGRVAAQELRSPLDVPAADVSQMDGYAVRAADLPAAGEEVTLPLGAMIAAGDLPGELAPGTARAIMTGAPVPAGADLVVPVEESAAGRFVPGGSDGPDGDAVSVVLTPLGTGSGRFVRPRGSATRRGDTILRVGQVLTPGRIAHLAACGAREVEARIPPRVLVLSTGSEVAPAGGDPGPGRTHDANGPGLAAALAEAGAEVVGTAAVPDDPALLLERLHAELESTDADLIVTSGGVSQGAREVVRMAAEHPEVSLAFPTLALQPGGPQGIGTLLHEGRRVPWIALPGNPVSALLSCELILRPALGAPPRRRLRLPLRLEDPARPEPSPAHLLQHRRARVLPSGQVRLVGGPGSHLVAALAAADALVAVPVGTDLLHDGDLVETILLTEGS
ncbi:molybdopterin molybdotransferase MoeA [Brachybacterium rhamnosum]|uniref:Molybdopterin molybdenumtransferase n=1 Tax=Brachybacterium rhamnosum TaxID=173361 RepID=A0ABW4PWW8_9MICO|nr:gephyrin-like molybdotransferase Glp [Brachybacterium sp. SGAir0954]QCR54690.1 molybdopterin molybdenumtransferase MoeA [Brachybacterium sp. SGAir0954]